MNFSPMASRALRDAYLDIYLLAARFLEGHVKPGQVRALRVQVEASIKRHRENLFRASIPEEWVNEVQLPVVGLIDEAARRSPTPGVADNWSSLQYPLYQHELVGRYAFEHLEKLRLSPDTPIEVIEIYVRCLAIGFQGEYAPHRLEDLKVLHESLKNELIRRMGKPPPLSPHVQSGAALVETPLVLRPPWIAGIALFAIMLMGLILTIMLSIDASRAESSLRAVGSGQLDK